MTRFEGSHRYGYDLMWVEAARATPWSGYMAPWSRGLGAGRSLVCAAPAPCEQAHQCDGTGTRDDSYHDQEHVNQFGAGGSPDRPAGGDQDDDDEHCSSSERWVTVGALAAAPGEHPLAIDGRRLRKVGLHHLSWSQILTEALVAQANKAAWPYRSRTMAVTAPEWLVSFAWRNRSSCRVRARGRARSICRTAITV
jgi:hypothetical protein